MAPAAPVSAPQRGSLLRILGIGFAIAIAIGNTIGAGLLRTPGQIATAIPSAGVFILLWLIGGLYALLGANSVAEIAAAIPRSGGFYVFARRAFGEYAGFIAGWSDFLSQAGSIATVGIVVGQFAGALFPALQAHVPTKFIGLALVMVLLILQTNGIRLGGGIQNTLSAATAIAFFAFVAAAFILGPRHLAPASPAGHYAPSFWIAVFAAIQAIIYTYDGWYGVIYFGEEVVHPERNIHRGMLRGVCALIAIYVLVNLAILHLMPMSGIAGKDLAIGAASRTIFGDAADTFIRALTLVTMSNGINAWLLTASRILFTMSKGGLLPQQVAYVNKGGTPIVGLLLTAITVVAFIWTGTFESVLAVMAFFFVVNYLFAYAAVFQLRRKEPNLERPYRAWGYPWTTGLALLGSAAFLVAAVYADPVNSKHSLIVLAASVPLFFIVVLLRRFSVKQES